MAELKQKLIKRVYVYGVLHPYVDPPAQILGGVKRVGSKPQAVRVAIDEITMLGEPIHGTTRRPCLVLEKRGLLEIYDNDDWNTVSMLYRLFGRGAGSDSPVMGFGSVDVK